MARRAVFGLLERLASGTLTVRCSDGTFVFGVPGTEPAGWIDVHDERMFLRVVTAGDIGLGEAFVGGEWTSPDLVDVLRVLVRNQDLVDDRGFSLLAVLPRTLEWLRHRLRANSRRGSRRNIAHHYDLGNEFYRLFLDRSLGYSCALYSAAGDSLEAAQQRKYDTVCRKLQLRPSDHVLEIGTGWAGLAIHAASRYGCRVTTTTISNAQFAWASERVAALGLDDRIRVLPLDYRELNGTYDKIMSIEMFEAVGARHYDTFFARCDHLLAAEGAMLLQTITVPDRRFDAYRRRRDWIQKHVFPGAELASIAAILASLARVTRLQLVHAEEIGWHYALTLRAWRERFLAARAEVRALGFGDRFLRMWEYYFSSCEAAFAEGSIGDMQLLLGRSTMAARALRELAAVSPPRVTQELVPVTVRA